MKPMPMPRVEPAARDASQRCVDGINRHRASIGLGPLQRWTQNEACASGQAADDARTRKPHGTFGRCSEKAQNVCPDWPGRPDAMIDGCLQMMWNEGPGSFPEHGHYMNMASTKFTRVACGYHVTSSGSVWAVQDFE
jgi:hypothetical protein